MEPTNENIYNAVKIDNRNVSVREGWLGPKSGPKSFYVNFYNIPQKNDVVVTLGLGATAENNRIAFEIHEQKDGRWSIETRVCVFPREYRLRKKTGNLETITKYVREHLQKIVREIAPSIK